MNISRAELLQKSMCSEPAFDGRPATVFVLENGQGMSLTFMDIGATWLSCEIPVDGEMRELLLGVNSMADHQRQSVYLGATVGRFANRIANGQFAIAGQGYQLACNQHGNTLHGGPVGFDKLRWRAEQVNKQQLRFTLISKDGDQGFPGNLQVQVSYQLSDSNKVTIEYNAVTDQACPVSLTNHAYFNLMGAESGSDCLQHQLMIAAQQYLPVNQAGIPLGHFKAVENTGFDFRKLKEIGRDFLSCSEQKMAAGYDHAFLLNKAYQDAKEVVAKCISADHKVTLELATTLPAIQLYTGNYLQGTPNRNGGQYQNYSGLALETQLLPDAPNHPEWPQPCPILMAGEEYRQQTCYQFIVNDLNE